MKFLFRRELSNYFNTPIGYVFAVACLFFNFVFFFAGIWAIPDLFPAFWDARSASIRSYMNLLPLTFILMVPAVSMRIWAEERKSGTLELISTLPLREVDLVLAKFLGAWVYVGLLIVASLPLAITIWFMGHLDWGSTLALYAGSILMAGAYVSTGMVVSALTREQIVAFIITFFISLYMFISNYYIVSQHLSPGAARLIGFFSHSHHFTTFSRGLLDAADVMYYVTFIGMMLTANVWILRRER